jgi:hypothetical protein
MVRLFNFPLVFQIGGDFRPGQHRLRSNLMKFLLSELKNVIFGRDVNARGCKRFNYEEWQAAGEFGGA